MFNIPSVFESQNFVNKEVPVIDLIQWLKEKQGRWSPDRIECKYELACTLKSIFDNDVYPLFIKPNLDLIWSLCIRNKIIEEPKRLTRESYYKEQKINPHQF